MRAIHLAKWSLLALAVVGLLLPDPAVSAADPGALPATPIVPVRMLDVALGSQGELAGQVVDLQGQAIPGQRVFLLRDAQPLAATVCGEDGRFAIAGLRGGAYQVTCAGTMAGVRAWAPGTAPPGAQPEVLLVAGDAASRGQIHPAAMFLSDPWVLAALIAVAIAVPVALHNRRGDRGSGS